MRAFDCCPCFFIGYKLKNGKTVCVIAEGRLVNLASGDGHPVEIMDMSFAVQALSLEYLVNGYEGMKAEVFTQPDSIDIDIAMTKLAAMGVTIDELTDEQRSYITGWQEGT